MTENTKAFIKKHFFKNERFAGWENIADVLLDKGTCIVAGDGNIWVGGIDNFIKKGKAENCVGCTVLAFDLDTFYSSAWFREIATFYVENLIEERRKTLIEITDIVADSDIPMTVNMWTEFAK